MQHYATDNIDPNFGRKVSCDKAQNHVSCK
jgi:hypothetical protein